MERLDISKEKLYLKNLSCVIKSGHYNRPRFATNGRHSDAFVYILAGSCTYRIEDEYEFTVFEGDILYLANNAFYTMAIQSEEYRFIYCDFDFDSDSPRKSDVFKIKNKQETENLFRKLLNCYKMSESKAFYECMAVLYQIYGVLLTAENKYIGKSAKQSILAIKEYIDKNFSDINISVARLAEKAQMSDVYLRKLFKSVYGTSPIEYITLKRLENAKQLMKYPFLSLENCAIESGFSSVQYFCRVFKKKMGISPAKFRKELLH